MAYQPVFVLLRGEPRAKPVSKCRILWQVPHETTYIPLGLELLQPDKGICDSLVGEDGPILLQRSLANLGVVGFRDRIFKKGLLQLVNGDDDTKDLGQGLLEVALGACLGKLYFLRMAGRLRLCHDNHRGMEILTSSRLIVAERVELGT